MRLRLEGNWKKQCSLKFHERYSFLRYFMREKDFSCWIFDCYSCIAIAEIHILIACSCLSYQTLFSSRRFQQLRSASSWLSQCLSLLFKSVFHTLSCSRESSHSCGEEQGSFAKSCEVIGLGRLCYGRLHSLCGNAGIPTPKKSIWRSRTL